MYISLLGIRMKRKAYNSIFFENNINFSHIQKLNKLNIKLIVISFVLR